MDRVDVGQSDVRRGRHGSKYGRDSPRAAVEGRGALTVLHILPALPSNEEEKQEAPPLPAPVLRLVPRWSGWSLRVTPGRASADLPEAPPTPLERPEKKRRPTCTACRRKVKTADDLLYHRCRQQKIPVVALWDFQVKTERTALQRRRAGTRKCSPFPRARTRSPGKARPDVALPGTGQPRRLPLLREECKGGERPCPMVSCRHHQAFTVDAETGNVKENYPFLRVWDDPDGPGLQAMEALYGTCAADVYDEADDGSEGQTGLLALYERAVSGRPIGTTDGLTLEEVAKRLGLSIERVRQLGARALQEVRVSLRRMGLVADGDMPRTPQHPLAAAAERGESREDWIEFGQLVSQRLREKFPQHEGVNERDFGMAGRRKRK